MTIYIDIVLIENLIMNYIILYTTGIVLKRKLKHIRLIIGSLLGAIYSIIAYMGIANIYSTFGFKILLSILIVFISFNPPNVKKMCKDILLFYLISSVFGGVAFSLIYIIKPQNIIMRNGIFSGTYPVKTIALGAIVAFLIIIIGFKIVKKKISEKDMFCQIEIYLNGKQINTNAMIDTGNLLKEPITNIPVIVVEHTLLYECIPKEILNNLELIIGGDFKNIPEKIKEDYILKLKLIPYSSLGKPNGMLLGVKAEKIKIIKDEQVEIKDNVIIGIYNRSLTKKGEYRALMGIQLL